MKKCLFIQARLSSKRLPKKVLKKICGKHLLKYLLDRVEKIPNITIVIVTSKNKSDDRIYKFCLKNNISCYRGPLRNVSKRMLEAATYFNADFFVRINADSPLIDPSIIEKALDIFEFGNFDLVTNVLNRSYPIGQSVEIVKTKIFKKIYEKMSTKEHFEHVTKYFYENSSKYYIKNFSHNIDLSKYSLAVDSSDDFERISNIINQMKKPHYDYSFEELINLYQKTN